jgi:hypothetical protein
VELISKITRLPIVGAQPEEYLEKKSHEKELAKLVKSQFGTNL